MKKFILNLQFLFKPYYWLMIKSYNKEIDIFVSDLLDKYDFEGLDKSNCKASLGGVEIWVANRPYSCMMPYDFRHRYRPSRLTIQKGVRKYEKAQKEKLKTDLKNLTHANTN